MIVTRETIVRDVIEAYPDVLEIFEEHGVLVDVECSDDVQDLDFDFCEQACNVDDVDALIEDINAYIASLEEAEA